MLDDAPEVWIGYERAFFESVHHRVENFIAGILLPHQRKKPDDCGVAGYGQRSKPG
ncbi:MULTISPECIES: hypothetical protein [Streptomyces violaceusniger group]|uniref:Transposase n=2 Tax=Streptomyces javensis TaxID=114698 RepID=A0ABN1X9I7_9ACTN|nr:hypothetical protein [Streptomyces javensis]MBI0317474.1 hypothetical protein [Streptomyces javensis]